MKLNQRKKIVWAKKRQTGRPPPRTNIIRFDADSVQFHTTDIIVVVVTDSDGVGWAAGESTFNYYWLTQKRECCLGILGKELHRLSIR